MSYFTTSRNGDKISYQDNRQAAGIVCRISETRHNELVGRSDWLSAYGFPCAEGSLTFGNTSHSYIMAANASKFFSPGSYDYWSYSSSAKATLRLAIESAPLVFAQINEAEFQFNPIVGTYEQGGRYDIAHNRFLAFYEPTNAQGEGNVVYGTVLEKLIAPHYGGPQTFLCAPNSTWCGGQNFVLAKLGFPTSERIDAAESFAGTEGEYQDFIGGQIYIKTSGRNKTYYVPYEIAVEFNRSSNCTNGSCGTGGRFGFPISDPFFSSVTNELLQKFEWKMVRYSINSETWVTLGYGQDERRKNNLNFALRLLKDKVELGHLADAEAFKEIADYIAYINDTDDDFVKDLTVLLAGLEYVTPYQLVKKEIRGSGFSDYFLVGFSDTGFKFKYNDSHYCVNLNGLSNQLLHSVGGFNIGYFSNLVSAEVGNWLHEQIFELRVVPSPLGTGGSSVEDNSLTTKMSILGAMLNFNFISRNEIGQWIMDNIAESSVASLRKSRPILKNECDVRKQFREFESSTFPAADSGINAFSYWYYPEDMKLESGQWVQHYEKFGDYRYVKAIYDSGTQQVHLVTN